MRISRSLSGSAFLVWLASCATAPSAPDLVVDRISAAPASATAGSAIEITSIVRNSGGAATSGPVASDIELVASGKSVALLRSWRQEDGEIISAGASIDDIASVRLPALQSGTYSICAIADPGNEIPESDENNNEACAPFDIAEGAPHRADLVIEKVTPVGQDQASLKVKIAIRNAGSEAAGPFRIMAFRRAPRLPILLIECPLTEGQLSSGSPATCDDLTQKISLAAGASAKLTGYLAYVVSNGASFVRNPIGPGNPNPLVRRDIDFMVDGCFPPLDGSPVYCAVDEIDELNNFKGATLKIR
jgi:hypothetical protein